MLTPLEIEIETSFMNWAMNSQRKQFKQLPLTVNYCVCVGEASKHRQTSLTCLLSTALQHPTLHRDQSMLFSISKPENVTIIECFRWTHLCQVTVT